MLNITRVTQGSVYEMDNGQIALVISDNKNNSSCNNITCCKVVQEDADNYPYRVMYDTMSGDVIVPNKILCNVIFSTKPSRLKTYRYSLDNSIMNQVKKEIQKILFGEELFSINEARNAIAEYDLAIRVALEKQNGITQTGMSVPNIVVPNSTPNISLENIPISSRDPIIDDNSSIDDIQSYYAKKMTEESEDFYDHITIPTDNGKNNEEITSLDMDFEGEDPETTDRVLNIMFMNEQATLDRMGEEAYENEFQDHFELEDEYEEEEKKLSKPRVSKRRTTKNFKKNSKKFKKDKVDIGWKKGAFILTTESDKEAKTKSKNSKYDHIYSDNNYLKYLESYYNEDKEKVAEEYGVDFKNLGNVAYRCRQICADNGELELLEQIKKEAGVKI